MSRLTIPPLMRDLTGGQAVVMVDGHTVGELVVNLDRLYPGCAARLHPGWAAQPNPDGELAPELMIVVDGTVASMGLRTPVRPDSEVHFIPALTGG